MGTARRSPSPSAGPWRTRLEATSRPLLIRMHAAPRWLIFLAFVALAVGAAVAPPPWGPACAVVLAAFLAWLLALAWPSLTSPQRLARIAVVGIVVGAAITRAVAG